MNRIILFPLLLILAWPGQAFGQSSLFGPEQPIGTEDTVQSGEYHLATADLDGDGDIDLLSASKNAHRITFFLNDGQGVFGLEQVIDSTYGRPSDLVAADIDNDGDMDVFAASQTTNSISLFLNNGAADFSPGIVISTALNGVEDISLGDLDGDGLPDLLSASIFDDKAAWYRNTGDGGFGPQQVISTAGDGTNYIIAADVDGDLDLDVLTTSQFDDVVAWYANDGSGNFGPMQDIPGSNSWPFQIQAGDLDGDGNLDIVVTNRNNRRINYQFGDGTGSFGSAQLFDIAVASKRDLALADLDLDGDLDIAYSHAAYTSYSLNDGLGNFINGPALNDLDRWALEVADVNNDDHPDLVLASYHLPHHVWHENILGKPSISGSIFYDMIMNGEPDLNEGGIGNIPVSIQPDALAAFSDGDGNFEFFLDAGTYTVSPQPGDQWQLTTAYEEAIIDVPDSGFVDTLLFGYSPAYFFHDATLVTAAGLMRCNSVVRFQVIFTNTGTSVMSGEVGVALIDNMVLVDTTIVPEDYAVRNDTVYWQVDELYPGASFTAVLEFLVEGPDSEGEQVCLNTYATLPLQSGQASLPPDAGFRDAEKVKICHCTGSSTNPYVFIEVDSSAVDGEGHNDHSHHECDIIPATDLNGDGEIDLQDCLFSGPPQVLTYSNSFKEVIRCSFDPNDKMADPPGVGEEHLTLFGQDVIYKIRFQNTGNDTAFHVTILDTLDNRLDISTFRFIAASHPAEVFIHTMNGGTAQEISVLRFEFEDILLPDSAVDQSGSNGYVQYSIRTLPDIEAGTVILNTAAIIFDANVPVITNTTFNTMVPSFGIISAVRDNMQQPELSIIPNPFRTSAELHFHDLPDGEHLLMLMGIDGKLLRQYGIPPSGRIVIERGTLASGIYLLQLRSSFDTMPGASWKLVIE